MRARLVRPEFWDDSRVAMLSDSVRLFYVGLWCVADDAGFLEWDLARVAHQLMPYKSNTARIRLAEKHAAVLVEAGRVEVLDCGRHAYIPTLERHRITGGNTSTRMAEEHRSLCGAVRVRTPSPDKSRSESLSPSLSESLSPRAGARGSNEPNREHGRKRRPTDQERRAELERQLGAETDPAKRDLIALALSRMPAP